VTRHADQAGDNLHVAARTVADDATRLAAEALLVAADVGLLILQLDDATLWYCDAAASLEPITPQANIVCFEDAVVCFEDEVVTLT